MKLSTILITLYPSSTSVQSMATLDGPSMVTVRMPAPALQVLMMQSVLAPVDTTMSSEVAEHRSLTGGKTLLVEFV